MLIKQSIVDMRANEACHADLHSKEYDELTKVICDLQHKIRDIISEARNQDKLLDLLEEMEDAIGQSRSIELKETYKQGFNDGLEIAALLLRIKV